jgi:hypothetical protein
MTTATLDRPTTTTTATGTMDAAAAPAAARTMRARLRAAGARALDYLGRAYAPPAGATDDIRGYYYTYLPM